MYIVGSSVKTDSEMLRWVGFQIHFKLVGQAVAKVRVAAVEVEVRIEVIGHIQAGFFQ